MLVLRANVTLLWRARLDAARGEYDSAIAELRQSGASGEVPGAADRIRAATDAADRARAHYVEILRVFTDLVVHGTMPADPPQR